MPSFNLLPVKELVDPKLRKTDIHVDWKRTSKRFIVT